MIPAEFTGGWVRASISLDGAEPFEDTLVWWLQSTSKHADLRLPLVEGEVISFAGTTTWEAPSLTWIPDLELVPNEFPDTGVVSWDGDDLLEAGPSSSTAPRWATSNAGSGFRIPADRCRRSAGQVVGSSARVRWL